MKERKQKKQLVSFKSINRDLKREFDFVMVDLDILDELAFAELVQDE
jgi:hypothetical protein